MIFQVVRSDGSVISAFNGLSSANDCARCFGGIVRMVWA